MSKKIEKGIVCPKCNNNVIAKIWGSVNINDNPGVKEKIQDGSLFMWKCPECNYETKLIYSCLYYDLNNQFMIYLIPSITNNNLEQLILSKKFSEFKGIKKRIVNSLEDFQEKINIFECGLSDKAIEITKLAFNKVLQDNKSFHVQKGYFNYVDKSKGTIHFKFIELSDSKEINIFTKSEAYEKALYIVNSADNEQFDFEFEKIDNFWADLVFSKYKDIDNNDNNI